MAVSRRMSKELYYKHLAEAQRTSLISKIPKTSVPEIEELKDEMKSCDINSDFYKIYISKLSGIPSKILKQYSTKYKEDYETTFQFNHICQHDPFESPLSAIGKLQERIIKGLGIVHAKKERNKLMLKNIKDLLDPIFKDKSLDVEIELQKFTPFKGPGYSSSEHVVPGFTVHSTKRSEGGYTMYVPGHQIANSYIPGRRYISSRPNKHYVPGYQDNGWTNIEVLKIEELGYYDDHATGFIAWSIRHISSYQEKDMLKEVLPLLQDMYHRTNGELRDWFNEEIKFVSLSLGI